MSLAMRQARYAQGDPGLFGFIGKALGGVAKVATGAVGGLVTGGPLGAIAGGVGALVPKPVGVAKYSGVMVNTRAQPLFQPVGAAPQLPGAGVSIGPGGVQIGKFGPAPMSYGGTGVTGPLVGTAPQTKTCQSGYHWNKAAYHSTKYGVVAKGTVCVKNRKRNPLNPRALSRAMSRVKSAQKAVRCLQLFAGPAARASAKAGKSGGRRGGKCRTCR